MVRKEIIKCNKKGMASVFLVLAALAGMLYLTGTDKQQKSAETSACTTEGFAMDTFFSLRAYGPEAETGLEACENKIRELEKDFSVTDPDSELAIVNRTGQGEVSYDTYSCVEKALQIGNRTEGALDITIYPVLKAWGFTTGAYQVPRQDVLSECLKYVNPGKVHREVKDGQYYLSLEQGMELDLGAVAKGYTGDCLVELLKKYEVTGGLLDLGGNIQVFGEKPDGSAWKIAVKNPFDVSRQVGVLRISGERAVVTSGNYERYFVDDTGTTYGHILDPESGRPVESDLASVTIVGKSGVESDGLSTALFVKGKEGAIEFWRQNRDFGMILVEQSGQVLVTEDLAPDFDLEPDGFRDREIIYGIRK